MNKSSLALLLLGSVFISNNVYSAPPPPPIEPLHPSHPIEPLQPPHHTYIFSDAVTDFCIFAQDKKKLGCVKHFDGMFVDYKDFPVTIANCDELASCRTYKLKLDYAPSWSWDIWGGSDLFWATKDILVVSPEKKPNKE